MKMTSIETIGDITRLNNTEVQGILGRLEGDDLAIALKGVSTTVIREIYANMTPCAVEDAKSRSVDLGQIKVDTIEAVHAKIIAVANAYMEKKS